MISGIRPSQSHPEAAKSGPGALVPWLTVGALLVLLAIGGDPLRQALRLEPAGLEAGEFWRLATGHLVHLGWSHALLNLAALVLVAIGFGRDFSMWEWLAIGTVAALAIDAGLLLSQPPVEWYVGLSGVLHGLVAAGAIGLFRSGHRVAAVIVTGVLVAKLSREMLFGALPHSVELSGGPVVVEAHLWGALGGALAALILLGLRRAPV